MFKNQHFIAIGGLLSIGLVYNNCAKISFDATVPLDATVSIPEGPQTGIKGIPDAPLTLTFNDFNQPATIAFNDNYPEPGDSDYNDFVSNIDVTESYDSLGALNKILIVYTAKYHVSAADHQLILGFDGEIRGQNGFVSNVAKFSSLAMFEGDAQIDYSLKSNGQIIAFESNHKKSTDLIVYLSTTHAVSESQVATITITHIDGALNNILNRGPLSIRRYRSVLFNGSSDIDLSDINSAFVDQSGAPVGFFVPVNWRPPKETQSIFPAYPQFRSHAKYLMSGAPLPSEPSATREWYNSIGDASLLLR